MPKRMPKGKKQLNVLISEDIYDLLIRLAPEIYGENKYRGALSAIVEEALRYYLLPKAHTQTHTNPKLSVRAVYFKVKEKISEMTHIPPIHLKEALERQIDLAISEVRGSDPRTIKKWKDIFVKQGLIKPIGGRPPNRIFELIA